MVEDPVASKVCLTCAPRADVPSPNRQSGAPTGALDKDALQPHAVPHRHGGAGTVERHPRLGASRACAPESILGLDGIRPGSRRERCSDEHRCDAQRHPAEVFSDPKTGNLPGAVGMTR
jgi:hypothetical protein